MSQKNLDILKSFNEENLPDLDVVVLGALELFSNVTPPKIEVKYKRPLVVGSGNAEATGKIIFKDTDAVFASESNFEEKLKNLRDIDGVVLISASGGKHAPNIARLAKKNNKKVTLITHKKDSLASKELDILNGDVEYVFPKNREPYTYNTSTYMGVILGQTGERANEINDFMGKNISTLDFSLFAKYDKFFFIVPVEFHGIIKMLEIKFVELFGRKIARDIATAESISHAMTVVPEKELFVSFGVENKIWGKPEDRIYIPLPKNTNYGAMMAIGYYIVGQIQKSQEPYFKENIKNYVEQSSLFFGHKINVIVD